MINVTKMTKIFSYIFISILLFVAVQNVKSQPSNTPEKAKTDAQLKLEKKAADEKVQEKTADTVSPDEILVSGKLPADIADITVNELRITGNKLISTGQILSDIPSTYNSSSLPLQEAAQESLYDLRPIRDLIKHPGHSLQISTRTIHGLTQSILAMYKAQGYSGIYVATQGVEGNKLANDILVIHIIEAPISDAAVNYYSPDGKKVEEGYLKKSALLGWSPAEVGNVAKQKELEDFVNLLNLNPDRYISPVISKGTEPNSLALGYNVYEANPWHWFVQVDNSGTEDRRWAPRIGLINTNLTGRDDNLTIYHQAKWEHGIEDKYSVYGKYDFPLFGPKLRLELFGAYNQFDIDGGGGIGFLGNGALAGGKLRYNVLQANDWFFDLTTSLSREKSKVSSTIFNSTLGSKVAMHLWSVGAEIHRRNDMKNTFIAFEEVKNLGGSDQDDFTAARTGAERDFSIFTASANHSQFLDKTKIHRASGSVRWIVPEDRLVPSKMTSFGGMYTVRGYEESGIVADGGELASIQYEFDLVKYNESKAGAKAETNKKPFVRKVAPLAFFDYGRASILHPVDGEIKAEELYSVGIGTLVDLGDNFSGSVYYGFPLKATSTTDTKDGVLNISMMVRW